MEKDGTLFQDAEFIDQQLRLIRRVLLQPYDADKSRVKLTGPQMLAMAVLAESLRTEQAGMTIRDLGKHLMLSQSTVSGLVNRLERKKLVARQPDPTDKRYTRIVLTDRVKTYLAQDVLEKRLNPLISALQQASVEERKTIVDGFTILARLLKNPPQPPGRLS